MNKIKKNLIKSILKGEENNTELQSNIRLFDYNGTNYEILKEILQEFLEDEDIYSILNYIRLVKNAPIEEIINNVIYSKNAYNILKLTAHLEEIINICHIITPKEIILKKLTYGISNTHNEFIIYRASKTIKDIPLEILKAEMEKIEEDSIYTEIEILYKYRFYNENYDMDLITFLNTFKGNAVLLATLGSSYQNRLRYLVYLLQNQDNPINVAKVKIYGNIFQKEILKPEEAKIYDCALESYLKESQEQTLKLK